MSLEGPPRGPNGKIKRGPPNNRPLWNRDRSRKFKAPKTNRPLMSSKDDKTNLFFCSRAGYGVYRNRGVLTSARALRAGLLPALSVRWSPSVLNTILKKWLPVILGKGAKSLNLIELRISKIDFYFWSLNIWLNFMNFKKLREKSELTKSKLTKLIKNFP